MNKTVYVLRCAPTMPSLSCDQVKVMDAQFIVQSANCSDDAIVHVYCIPL